MDVIRIVKGATSQIVRVYVFDSSSPIGAGLANLVYNSGSLVCEYARQNAAAGTAVSLVTMTAGTWTTSGFVETDTSGTWEGWYDIGIPNAALAATDGIDYVDLHLYGAANMVPVKMRIELVDGVNLTASGDIMSPNHLVNTVVDTPTSQTIFTLTAGSADDNAYVGKMCIITDQTTSAQRAVGIVSAYVGSTKQVTLAEDPGVFTMVAGDTIDIIALDANMAAISQDAIAANKLELQYDGTGLDGDTYPATQLQGDNLLSGIIFGAAATGTLSTTAATTDLTGYTANQLISGILIVLTGNAAGERTTITDYASSGGLLTFDAITLAMADGDTFKIV